MIIHFFRKRDLPRIDFYQLIDVYFDSLPNVSITSNDDEVSITIDMYNFNFKYNYLITKRSHILSIYRLNPEYININLLCEIPSILPQYISRLIFKQISEICDKFDLALYYDKLDNIHQFDMFELITALGKERIEYMDKHNNTICYSLPMNTVNDMCQYQNSKDLIRTFVKDDVIIPSYNVLYDKEYGIVKNSVTWKVGTPSIFPPHLDYVQVVEEENFVDLIPIETFYKYALKFMNELDDQKNEFASFRLLYLSEKASLKVKKLVKKMKKVTISLTNFDVIKITDLTEK